MDGIGSQVLIDESGNRYGDYSLLAMVENDEQQFKFKVNIISTGSWEFFYCIWEYLGGLFKEFLEFFDQ